MRILKDTIFAFLFLYCLYMVHVISFVEGFNLSTDEQYDRIHWKMVKDGMSYEDILKVVEHKNNDISYQYVDWPIPKVFFYLPFDYTKESKFFFQAINDSLRFMAINESQH